MGYFTGVSKIVYDPSLGSGGGQCELTTGFSKCFYNATSKEHVACAVWDAAKVNCLAAGPFGTRSSFAGSDSIIQMASKTVSRQGQQMIPVFAAAVGLVYNLPSPDLVLSRQAVDAIFTGRVVSWDDPVIQATNPDLVLPNFQVSDMLQDGAWQLIAVA